MRQKYTQTYLDWHITPNIFSFIIMILVYSTALSIYCNFIAAKVSIPNFPPYDFGLMNGSWKVVIYFKCSFWNFIKNGINKQLLFKYFSNKNHIRVVLYLSHLWLKRQNNSFIPVSLPASFLVKALWLKLICLV